MNNLTHNPDFKRAMSQVHELYNTHLPIKIAAVAEKFFVDSFRAQGFTDKMLRPWKATKKGKKSYLGHSAGILIGKGALMRSVRTLKSDEAIVHIAAGDQHVPYAKIHNEGFDGNQSVKSYARKTKKGSVTVQAHSRHMVMPQRQFMGNSTMLNENIDKVILREVNALERKLFNH